VWVVGVDDEEKAEETTIKEHLLMTKHLDDKDRAEAEDDDDSDDEPSDKAAEAKPEKNVSAEKQNEDAEV
jgi:hypothetical protein